MNLKEYEKFKIDFDLTEDDIASVLNCSRVTLSKKKNENKFTLSDLNILAKKYSLNRDSITKIFF